MAALNLFEFLSRPVLGPMSEVATDLTEHDDDDYDAPSGAAAPHVLGSEFAWAESMNTRADTDTYDDDAGLGPLGVPRATLETDKTAAGGETYDNDADAAILGMPCSAHNETYVTKVQNETYDDASVESLSFPIS